MSTKQLLEERPQELEQRPVEQEAEQEGPISTSSEIEIPDITFMKKRKFIGKRIIKICSCGNPYCRSPISDPERWKWVDLEVDVEEDEA